MTQTTIQLRVLQPSAGMVLTNGETYSKMVYLGVTDNPENWWEVSEEEMEQSEEGV